MFFSVIYLQRKGKMDYQQQQVARHVARTLRGRNFQGFPIRRSFVFSPEPRTPSPMVELMRTAKGGGGKGGRVRLLLYLAALWIAGTQKDENGTYFTQRAPRFWAELLELEDPSVKGARAIRNARDALIERGLFLPHPDPRVIILCREDRKGEKYSIPTGGQGDSYFRVPEEFFTGGKIKKMTLPGIAMYVIALSVVKIPEKGMPPSLVFRPHVTQEKFGLADLSRKKGIKELIDLDIFIDVTDPLEIMRYGYGYEGQPRNLSKSVAINPAYLPRLTR